MADFVVPCFIGGFELDASVNETHSFESEVTDHPVEKGADVTDHVRARPIMLMIEGVVSDSPIGDIRDRRSVTTSPSNDALAHLLDIRDKREPIVVETALKVYENMVLQSLEIPRSASTGEALRFRATFKQVQLVTNLRTTIFVAFPSGAKKVNRGNKPSKTVTNAPGPSSTTPTARKSILAKLKDSALF